ncbi:MAG: hypothetical protein EPN91_08050 [Salinibacterium sp.]|nr:MAG: hypothetical protein EPN91_08050 [Salinibacterium sp.]
MTEFDELMSSSLKRVAQPGDPAGVADAIRARVDAGDIGTPAQSSGFGSGGVLPWLPWLGLLVVAGVAGGALGASGVLGGHDAQSSFAAGSINTGVSALGCPGGSPVVALEPGQRVLAMQRSDDSEWLAVRDPLDLSRTVWLPTAVVVIDPGQADLNSLPIGGCPEPTLIKETHAPAAPKPTAKPSTPGDTSVPTITSASGSPNPFYNDQTITIKATAVDNVAVTSVHISWSGAVSGSGTMTKVGSEWHYQFSTTAASFGTVTFTLRAADAAGNKSAPVNVVTSHNYFG